NMDTDMFAQFFFQIVRGLHSALHCDESDNALSLQFVRPANDRRFGDLRVTHQRTLDLRGTEPVTSYVQNVIDSADDPKIAVLVATRAVAGQIISLVLAPVLFIVALLVAVDCAQHRRPRTANN